MHGAKGYKEYLEKMIAFSEQQYKENPTNHYWDTAISTWEIALIALPVFFSAEELENDNRPIQG